MRRWFSPPTHRPPTNALAPDHTGPLRATQTVGPYAEHRHALNLGSLRLSVALSAPFCGNAP